MMIPVDRLNNSDGCTIVARSGLIDRSVVHALPILATVVSALLYGLAFPPWRLWPLAWVSLVPFLAALRGGTVGSTLLLGWLWTMTLSLEVIPWFGSGFASYFGHSPPVGVAVFLAVPTVTGALDYMVFAAAVPALWRVPATIRPLFIAAAWVAAELGRTHLFFGNPWELLSYSQLDAGPLSQIADTTGMYGVSFIVVAANAGVAGVLFDPNAQRRLRSPVTCGLWVAAAAAGLAFAGGTLRERAIRNATAHDPRRRVVVVQGNVDVGTQWQPEFYGANLDVQLRLTADALRDGTAVVFWPESAMTFFLEHEPPYRKWMASVLRASSAQLVAGGVRAPAGDGPPYYNSAFLLASDGTIAAHYDKLRLIPFAERFPLLRSDVFLRRFARVREFTPGTPTAPLPTDAGRAGVLICNEALFPAPAAEHARAGAEYLVTLANDAWTSAVQYGETALDFARARAIEQRRYVVRSSTSGPSAIIDVTGRIVTRTAPRTQAVLAGDIRPGEEITPYARFGDWFAGLCLFGAVLGLSLGIRSAMKDRCSTGADSSASGRSPGWRTSPSSRLTVSASGGLFSSRRSGRWRSL
jgi:apolipoprotein N-acyltransferase